MSLIRDLVGKAAEINQLSFLRLLSYWKRRFSTVSQKENALFILNSSSHVLFATNRFEPNCEPNLGEVLNLSIALDWLSRYSNSYFVFICLQCMYDINLFTFHIIKQRDYVKKVLLIKLAILLHL